MQRQNYKLNKSENMKVNELMTDLNKIARFGHVQKMDDNRLP